MLGADDRPSTAGPSAKPAIEIYQEAQAKAGPNAADQVRLALWCEAHGLSTERMKHLALAVVYDPSHALARGLLGLVAYQGKWERPEVVGQQIENDPAYQALIREYLDRRAKTASKADAQLRLAAWCDQNGLKEQALAHYNEVVRLDPSREAAWRHLGYKRRGNRWVKPEDAAAEKKAAEHQKLADKQWKSKLEKVREDLTSKDRARRDKAEQGIAEVTDPRAVPMIWRVFAQGNERLQAAAVRMLGQIDGPAASNALAALAVFSPRAEVRRYATETLTRRDPRDVIGRLIGLLRKPLKYQVRPIDGPGSTGVLFVEGERFNVQQLFQTAPVNPSWFQNRIFTSSIPFDPFSFQNLYLASLANPQLPFELNGSSPPSSIIGSPSAALQTARDIAANPRNSPALLSRLANTPQLPGDNFAIMLATESYRRAALLDLEIAQRLESLRQINQAMQADLAMAVQTVETANAGINQVNDRVIPILKTCTGQDLGVEPEKWKSWWTDQLGYVYQSSQPETKPTYSSFETAEGPGGLAPVNLIHHACFAAGTPVSTVAGPRAIESIQVGDRVLSQNTSTGLLAFQPVMVIHRNEPAGTLRIEIGDETIVATGIHRFWKAGTGWTMARELKAGDRLRGVGGVTEVRSIVKDETQPVYNLEVAGNRNFFVGSKGVLVHDFSFVQPVLEPFDRQPDLEARLASAK